MELKVLSLGLSSYNVCVPTQLVSFTNHIVHYMSLGLRMSTFSLGFSRLQQSTKSYFPQFVGLNHITWLIAK